MGLIAGLNATGQWNNYLLFTHPQPFHKVDPVFHKDLELLHLHAALRLLRRHVVPRLSDHRADRDDGLPLLERRDSHHAR